MIRKYDDNGMFRFESIPTNNDRGVPLVVRERRMRKKLTKVEDCSKVQGSRLKVERMNELPQWVCGVHCASHAEQNSISQCSRIHRLEH